MREFYFNWPQEVIDVGCNIMDQFAAELSSDMMNDLVKVVPFPPDEAIAAL
jgi:hypothetical protein